MNFMIEFGIFEKIQLLFSCLENPMSNTPAISGSFIDESVQKDLLLQEMSGEDMARLMKSGTRVRRGPDWKWEDQVQNIDIVWYEGA